MYNHQTIKNLAKKAYWVEDIKEDKPYKIEANNTYLLDDLDPKGRFKVVDTINCEDNGMVAFSCFLSKGSSYISSDCLALNNLDTSTLFIAFGGTNFADVKDLNTDLQMIAGGNTDFLELELENKEIVRVAPQCETAIKYVEKMMDKYPTCKIVLCGHSLGMALAMYVALKLNLTAIGFSSPDINKMITEEELEYMQNHREKFINFRNKKDPITAYTGNLTKTAILIDNGPSLNAHNIDQWTFDSKGNLLDAKGQVVTLDYEPEIDENSNLSSLLDMLKEKVSPTDIKDFVSQSLQRKDED